jgi:two-component system cell cycle sensor histidine kinase/response regulator CckA
MRDWGHSIEHRSRILIVDDDGPTRRLFEAMLEPEGFEILMAASGAETLAILSQQAPDLILLDVMMADMDGYKLVERIKSNPARDCIPVIMITVLQDREARLLALKSGAEDFLTKPVDRAELCMRVRNLLRLKAYADYHDKYSQMLEGEVGSSRVDVLESERLYRSTFDAAPVGIVHISLERKWRKVNQRLCDLLGYSREELRSTTVQKRMLADEGPAESESFRRMAAGELDHYVVNERRFQRRDGSAVFTRVNMSVHRDTEGQVQHFISVIEDITASMQLEAQLRQASKMDAIGQLAAGVAHDFNNLLSVIIGYSDLLIAEVKQGDPMRADLDEIRGAGLKAEELTRQLLTFSRRQVLQLQPVDLTEVVAGMERMLGRLLGAGVELTASGASGLALVMVDPGQVEQVIMNLAVNARDAMPAGGRITIETEDVVLDEAYATEHIGVKAGPHVMLAVTDTGTGMDKAMQARIFEPFFTTKPPGVGTGLGLATVFGIVQQSGGTICVQSEVGKGTRFEAYFPSAARGTVAPLPVIVPEPRALRGSETILLVEDEEGVRTLARTILRKYGYHVLEAQSPGDAMLLCEQHDGTIHLLLTDVVMPRMSGRQLAERLVRIRPAMKVLYMSGYTDDVIMREGIQQSRIAFIHKPITPEALARKLRTVFESAAA